MKSYKKRLLATTLVPVLLGLGAVGMALTAAPDAPFAAPCSARNPCNPCAARSPCNPCAAKNPCAAHNPCAAKNPCGASNPCNPRAAHNPCGAGNPCNANPCAGGMAASSPCVVPRLASAKSANPCAAKNPCNPRAPHNPCGAGNPCSPCAAKNPCNPCAAHNPCGASNPCSPCNPCAAAEEVELTPAEAVAAYDCLDEALRAGYAKSGLKFAKSYGTWNTYNTQPYQSATHGSRFVNNYANPKAKAYGKYEQAGTMGEGAILVKDSFLAKPNGKLSPGPLFVMEKMAKGFDAGTGDWRYTLIMPTGAVYGTTGGKGAASVAYCADCHEAVEDQDYLYFLPEEFRN